MSRHDTETRCHCGREYGGSDHCPECYCEQYESGDCGWNARCGKVSPRGAECEHRAGHVGCCEAWTYDQVERWWAANSRMSFAATSYPDAGRCAHMR
jgi:hypothetical protein